MLRSALRLSVSTLIRAQRTDALLSTNRHRINLASIARSLSIDLPKLQKQE